MSKVLYRLLGGICCVLFVHALAFFMLHQTRGGPFDQNQSLDPITKAALEKSYNLDQPLINQYLNAVGGLFKGEFGPSLQFRGIEVKQLLAEALPISLTLGFGALFIAILISFLASWASLSKINSNSKKVFSSIATILLATPNFVIAGLLIVILSFSLGWFPVAGDDSPLSFLLPCLALALPLSAQIYTLVADNAQIALQSTTYRSALARGLSKTRIFNQYVLRPSVTPVLAYLGPATAALLTGSLVIEQIFALPGLGTFFVQAALARDYTLALGVTVCYTTLLAICTFIADILLLVVDPRTRKET